MKKIIFILLIFFLSLTIISCAEKDEYESWEKKETLIQQVPSLLIQERRHLPKSHRSLPLPTTQPPIITSVPRRQEPLLTVEAAPVPLHRPRQVITQSPSAHSVTAPMITAQSW